jgi:serine/threonine-protein kinase
MLGTPAFMAPEQAKGHWSEVDAHTDLWAVGATMFTLLTGEYVHLGNTPNEMLAFTITQPARSIRSLLPELHPALAAVIDRALAYQKHERWPDARAMQRALRAAGADIERSGPFVVSPVTVRTHHDASSSPRWVAASPDARTLPAHQAAGDTASTLVSPEATPVPRTRSRRALLGAGGALVVVGAMFALFRSKDSARESPSMEPSESAPAMHPLPETTPSVTSRPASAVATFVSEEPSPPLVATSKPSATSIAPSALLRPSRPTRKTSEPPATKAPKPPASSDPFARRR